MQFPVWMLQMLTSSRSSRCGGENYIYAGDAYLSKRQNNTSNKMYPMEQRLCLHPKIVKKMRTFLEVEGKMGLILQPTSSQYRPPQADSNPNVRKDKAIEKRKRRVPIKRLRPNTVSRPGETAACPPMTISKSLINAKPQADVSENRPPPLEDAPVHETTPWHGTGKMSGNLFKDRNWLLPPNYLNNDNKNATGITSPKPP